MATEFNNPDIGQDPPPFPGRDMNGDSEHGSAQAVKKEVGEMLDGAKEGARSALNQKKDSAAAGIDDVAAALHDASQRRQDQGDDSFARLAGSAADGLQRFSGTLRNKDVGTMLRDVNSFAHRQPVAFFGLAIAAGVLATRFIKAGND